MFLERYYENLDTLHVNTCKNRAYYIPFGEEEFAGDEERALSDRYKSLNGLWQFTFFQSPYDLPENLLALENKESMIPVPSVWQMHGYDKHMYTNVQFPFPYDPPYVPHDNPCGWYTREFEWCSTLDNEKSYINFEGVDSCFYLYLNGKFVGYSQVSHSTSEFDISDFLIQGDNRLDVIVLKWCDGSYFEDQDKFRTSGIFRDVYIISRPSKHIRDYFIKTALSNDYKKVKVTVDLEMEGQCITNYSFQNEEGEVLKRGKSKDNRISFSINDPILWNAEKPYLYVLTMHCNGEYIVEHVGIREITVKNGIVYLNGQNIKFRGVNRHDSSPTVGSAVSYADLEMDLLLIKSSNFNAIRTSHYPNSPLMPKLCDRIGLYVVAEADLESHGTIFSGKCLTKDDPYNLMARDPQFLKSTVDRAQLLVHRDKNRSCVLIWSMGNEAGHGENFNASLKWTKEFDSTRLTHYERGSFPPEGMPFNEEHLDTYSRMYPSIEEIDTYFEKKTHDKPYILCEYIHAMGNSLGGAEDYFQCIERHDGHCGGFVWEWCDHAILVGKTIEGKEKYFYGGDFKEFPHDGNFCMDGLVYPDRTPHQSLLEYKNIMRPVRIKALDLSKGRFSLHNHLDFTNSKDCLFVAYKIYVQGNEVTSGQMTDEQLDCPPHSDHSFTLEVPKEEYSIVFLQFNTVEDILPSGDMVGMDQLGTASIPPVKPSSSSKKINVTEDDRYIILSTDAFRYAYNKLTGTFETMVKDHINILEKPMEFNIWRAPTDNDRVIREQWEFLGFDKSISRAYTTTVEKKKGKVVLTTDFSIAPAVQPPAIRGVVTWTIHGNGEIEGAVKASTRGDIVSLPRFGIRMMLQDKFESLRYFGYGPYESYIDKTAASYKGWFDGTTSEQHEDYLKPQENYAHFDTDYVSLDSNEATLVATGKGFSFNVSHYTQEELTQKLHNFELEKSGYTVFCLDYAHTGIGTNSCGPELPEKYALKGDISFTFLLNFQAK